MPGADTSLGSCCEWKWSKRRLPAYGLGAPIERQCFLRARSGGAAIIFATQSAQTGSGSKERPSRTRPARGQCGARSRRDGRPEEASSHSDMAPVPLLGRHWQGVTVLVALLTCTPGHSKLTHLPDLLRQKVSERRRERLCAQRETRECSASRKSETSPAGRMLIRV